MSEQTRDEQQTRACAIVTERLRSIIWLANEALNQVGSEKGSDLIESISSDATKALLTNDDICADMIGGY